MLEVERAEREGARPEFYFIEEDGNQTLRARIPRKNGIIQGLSHGIA